MNLHRMLPVSLLQLWPYSVRATPVSLGCSLAEPFPPPTTCLPPGPHTHSYAYRDTTHSRQISTNVILASCAITPCPLTPCLVWSRAMIIQLLFHIGHVPLVTCPHHTATFSYMCHMPCSHSYSYPGVWDGSFQRCSWTVGECVTPMEGDDCLVFTCQGSDVHCPSSCG